MGIAVIAGKIYVAGGTPDGPNFPGVTDEYDPVADTWTRRATMPTHRVFRGGSNAVVGGVAWFVGGLSPASCSDATEGYDASDDSWSSGIAFPAKLCGVTVLSAGSHVYAIGGATEGNFVPMEVRRYDPGLDTWETRPAPFPRTRPLAAGVELAGKLYVIGGATSPFAVDIYNPVTDVWSAGTSLPLPRADAAAAAVGGKIYVAGGIDELGMTRDLVDIYDPSTNSWSTGTPLIKARSAFGLVVVGTTLFAIGGNTMTGPIADVEALETE
jgi:N-acetylneuraminic acid mutarotase